ncbi:hypothetical protein CKN96_06015 [Carnobacterium maltaromaticum]|nr:transporter substrate-binding domain-containing protein [Carnobacterium maltaromaticum]TFJ58785.1 hypothetical protein CKN96_06015 [Carnobacterium maltaromaticum]
MGIHKNRLYLLTCKSKSLFLLCVFKHGHSIELVLGNRADGTVNDDVTFFYYQKEKPENKIRLIDEAIATSEIAAITNKNNPELTKAIDGALAELKKEGITSKLSITYFGKDITENK